MLFLNYLKNSAVGGLSIFSGLTLTTLKLYTSYSEFQDSQKIKLEALISKNEELKLKCVQLKDSAEVFKTRVSQSEVLENSNFFDQIPVFLILKGVFIIVAGASIINILNSGSLVAHLHKLSSSIGLARSETKLSGIDLSNNALTLKQDFLLNQGEKGVSLFFGENFLPINVGSLLSDSASLLIVKKAYEKSSLDASQALLKVTVQEETLTKQTLLINEKMRVISELEHQIVSLGVQISELQDQVLNTSSNTQELSDIAFALLGS